MTWQTRLMIAASALACVGAQALAQTGALPGSPEQARDALHAPGAPARPIVWGMKNLFQQNHDLLHYTPEPPVQIEPGLMARNREARDQSVAAARGNMMQRYAAAREAQQTAVGAGAPPGDTPEDAR